MTPQLAAVFAALGGEPAFERAGNLAWARAAFEGRPVRVVLVENRTASGSLGRLESDRLARLFAIAAHERVPLVLGIDSAGARVSEGLQALGAFRALYRAGLHAALAGVPMAAVLGANCYGGASMLAHLAARRLFGPGTRLAMSGPAILASSAGMSATDEMFRAMAEAAMAPAARASVNPANTVYADGMDVAAWLREALAPRADMAQAFRERHAILARRLPQEAPAHPEAVRRRDLERLYAEGYEAREAHGFLEGHGMRGGHQEEFVGVVGNSPLGIARAWRLADFAWRHVDDPPARVEVMLDCASHAPRLEDERAIQSEFIVDMAAALAVLAARGTRVGLTVLGKAGGGVYVALAAPAARVASLHGADIQVLPGAAVAAILGKADESVPSFTDYRAAGVADDELRLGLVPGTP